MTEQEYFNLSNNDLYEFILYYGTRHVGILVKRESNNYYIVPPNKIKAFNDGFPLNEIGKKVQLSSIVSHSIYKLGRQPSHASTLLFTKQTKVKKLIILGAGASFDFSYDPAIVNSPNRPPLANNLFSDNHLRILNKYPGAFHLSTEILLSNDIEHYFQSQWNKIENTTNTILFENLVNTQFYLHELFEHISNSNFNNRRNNYSFLAKQAHEYSLSTGEHIAIVSFNYDTLIEEALVNQARYHFNSLNDYIDYENKHILLFKPHGSWNWVKRFKSDITNPHTRNRILGVSDFAKEIYQKRMYHHQLTELLEDNISIYNKPNNVLPGQIYKEFSHLPQLLIPYKEKDEYIMPEGHENYMNYFLRDIEDILIVGWKGAEIKFQELLKNKLNNKKISVNIVNNDSGDSIVDLFKTISPSTTYYNHKTFSDYIKNLNDPKNHSHFFSIK